MIIIWKSTRKWQNHLDVFVFLLLYFLFPPPLNLSSLPVFFTTELLVPDNLIGSRDSVNTYWLNIWMNEWTVLRNLFILFVTSVKTVIVYYWRYNRNYSLLVVKKETILYNYLYYILYYYRKISLVVIKSSFKKLLKIFFWYISML